MLKNKREGTVLSSNGSQEQVVFRNLYPRTPTKTPLVTKNSLMTVEELKSLSIKTLPKKPSF